ncbi:MAG: ATP-binding protein [Chloroflexota bacterium]
MSEQRQQRLEKLLEEAYELKYELFQHLLVTTSPIEMARLQLELEIVNKRIEVLGVEYDAHFSSLWEPKFEKILGELKYKKSPTFLSHSFNPPVAYSAFNNSSKFEETLRVTPLKKQELITLLLACPSIANRASRDNLLKGVHKGRLIVNLARYKVDKIDVKNIVNTLLEYSGALEELISFIRLVDSGTKALQALEIFQSVLLVDSFPSHFLEGVRLYPPLSKPAINPYEGVSGRPAYPPNFVGREAILKQIESIWNTRNQLPPIILYGHRRMGKTSILRNLKIGADSKDILVFIDMARSGLVDNNAQFFLSIAEEIEKKVKAAEFNTGNLIVKENFDTPGNARRTLDKLFDLIENQIQDHRLILAIDEFEIIQVRIEEKRIEPGALEYLRAVNQAYNWLGLIFAGLHELEEMGRDYKGAFYGSAKHIKVSYLQEEDAHKLITQPDIPEFKLKYEPDLVSAIYFLTYGQPYLIQILCSELVSQWNEKWEEQKGQIEPLLTIADLDEALTERFFMQADYYFEGVWTQIGEKEHKLLTAVATWQEENRGIADTINPLSRDQARNLVKYNVKEFEQVFYNLQRRDLMQERIGNVSFFSEIMRRWVVRRSLEK